MKIILCAIYPTCYRIDHRISSSINPYLWIAELKINGVVFRFLYKGNSMYRV